MVEYIFFIIVNYLVAKVIGVALHAIRAFLQPTKFVRTPPPTGNKQRYDNIQDVDYEEIKDPK